MKALKQCCTFWDPESRAFRFKTQRGMVVPSLMGAEELECGWNNFPFTLAHLTVLGRLLRSGALGSLQRLFLQEVQLRNEGMKVISTAMSSGSLANLTELNLGRNQIGDEGMQVFSTAIRSGSMGKLTV